MALIPEVTITDFRNIIKKKVPEIKELKSFLVTSDGSNLFYIIIPPANCGMSMNDSINIDADALGFRSNIVGGKDPLELIKESVKT